MWMWLLGGGGPLPAFGSLDYRRATPAASYSTPARQTVIHLFANTVLGVDKLVATETGAGTVTETELDLRKGHLLGNVKKPGPGSEFRIRYPKGMAAITHGGIFDMTVEDLQEVKQANKAPGEQVHVTFAMTSGTGVISFTGPDGKPVTVPIQTMQAFDSSNLTGTMNIPTLTLDTINSIVPGLNPPPTAVVHLPDPSRTSIQYVAPVVTATAGTVTED